MHRLLYHLSWLMTKGTKLLEHISDICWLIDSSSYCLRGEKWSISLDQNTVEGDICSCLLKGGCLGICKNSRETKIYRIRVIEQSSCEVLVLRVAMHDDVLEFVFSDKSDRVLLCITCMNNNREIVFPSELCLEFPGEILFFFIQCWVIREIVEI